MYKHYGDDRYYKVLNIDFLENGNLVICGQSTINIAAPLNGFFMFLNQEGGLVNTSHISSSPDVIQVFPVPTTNKLYVNLDLKSDALWVITDLMGNTLSSEKNIDRGQIDVSSLLPGIYF